MGERKFFLTEVDARITFASEVEGRVLELTIHQKGRDTRMKRLSDVEP